MRAGLQLVEDVARLQNRAGVRLQARVGVATGHVVVGDLISEGASEKDAVSGQTPNLAARLQALAAPGSVVISQATRRLVGDLFELADLGPHRLKGFAEPLVIWQVVREGRSEGRFEALHGAQLTPLVGREEEIALLLRHWQRAQSGEGQVVLLFGEPGIGKSRIARELRARLEDEPYVSRQYQCSPHHTTSPLHPVIEQMERAAGFARDDLPEARLDKLEALLARGTDRLDQAAPLIAALLGVPTHNRYPPLDLRPQRQKQRTLEMLVDQLEGLTAEQPMLLVYEDVHWIDPTTQELLSLAIERTQRLPVLTIITFRPEFTPPWPDQPHVSTLALTRLDRCEGAAMVDRVVGAKALPAEVAAQIVAKADGVPLFVEELTKAVLESGLIREADNRYGLAGPLPQLAIPATLHDSLLARLDRLASVKEVAQIGAAIGRDFSRALLAAVANRPEAEVEVALDQLVASELVFRSRTSPEAPYTFKHALVQDAAYGTLLKARRQHLHASIAKMLEERFADMVDKQPEVLAHHSTQAGLLEKAVEYWHRAGQLAVARSAISEAIAQLTTGLEVLRGLPDSEDRARRELDLQVTLADALRSAKRYGDELDRAYRRARELCEQLGEISQLVQVVYGQYVITFNGPNVPAAAKFADELLRIACKHKNSAASVLGEQAAGNAYFARGNFSAARFHLERALASSHRLDLAHAQYPALSLTYLSSALFLLGYPDQARDRCEQALAEARRAPPLTLALTLDNTITLEVLRRDEQAVREHADTLSCLAAEMENPFFLYVAMLARGWTVARRDQIRGGIALMREGMDAIWASGMQVQAPYQLAQLAEAYRRMGDMREGLGCIGEAFARAEETGERWYDAELSRLKGDLLAAERPASAEACFRQAITIAQGQQAKLWELRAATSLARLWLDQGRRAEAHDLLAPVYGWFTEGFDTADLKDAKALLDDLA